MISTSETPSDKPATNTAIDFHLILPELFARPRWQTGSTPSYPPSPMDRFLQYYEATYLTVGLIAIIILLCRITRYDPDTQVIRLSSPHMVTYTELFQQTREQLPSAAPYGLGSRAQQDGTIVPETASFDRHTLNGQARRWTTGLHGSAPENIGQARGRASSRLLPIDYSELRNVSLSPPRVGERFEEVERPVEGEPETIEEEYDNDNDLSDFSDADEEAYEGAKLGSEGSDVLVEEQRSEISGRKTDK